MNSDRPEADYLRDEIYELRAAYQGVQAFSTGCFISSAGGCSSSFRTVL